MPDASHSPCHPSAPARKPKPTSSIMSDQGSPSPSRSGSRSPSPRADDNENKKSPNPSDSEDKERNSEEQETSRRSRSRSPAPAKAAAKPDVVNPGNNVYVANLATRVGEQDLQELFSKYGRVDKCEVIVDPVTKESRGFGFVTFEDIRDAEDAVKELNNQEIQGRKIRVEHAKRKRGHEKTPGQYLGPRLASAKYGRDRRDRSRDRGRRSRSRDRGGYSRRYDDRDRGRHDDRDRGRGRYDDRDRGRGGYDRDDRRRR
ncbi:putative RNA-binding protein C25G10.01 [Phytophthora citrophthora]|uniref:RNA-binding protein C25G10.01 n=1 Tax=Phytophthora citrophthora TaxID=4793 RepID=A0AAD9LTX9_9STRA|nr:putative RNA-binding protein C25G10.01 [Phytophthora citrophthora]